MNKNYLILLLIINVGYSQDQFSRFSISAHYGPAYNFFVDYDRPVVKDNGYFEPPIDIFGSFEFIQKNKVGTIGGFQLEYNFKSKNKISLVYSREVHFGKFKGNYMLDNGTIVLIEDIKLRHLNEFYELNYKREISKSNSWYLTAGVFILNLYQSELSINPTSGFIELEERNNKNSRLQEGGFSLGTEYYFYRSGQFELGAMSKLYFTASIGEFETFTITPVLRFNF